VSDDGVELSVANLCTVPVGLDSMGCNGIASEFRRVIQPPKACSDLVDLPLGVLDHCRIPLSLSGRLGVPLDLVQVHLDQFDLVPLPRLVGCALAKTLSRRRWRAVLLTPSQKLRNIGSAYWHCAVRCLVHLAKLLGVGAQTESLRLLPKWLRFRTLVLKLCGGF
jgi:hypothetical protein